MEFGKFIRTNRAAVGLPMNVFATSMGVSSAYWSRIERGLENAPKDDHIFKAAALLGLESDDAFIAANRLPPDIKMDIRKAVQIYRENS